MTREGGISARYTAHALALELGWSDVDAMLESMTVRQYREWLAFFKIRADREKEDTPATPEHGYGTSKEGQDRMSADILRAMTGYQQRRDTLKGS